MTPSLRTRCPGSWTPRLRFRWGPHENGAPTPLEAALGHPCREERVRARSVATKRVNDDRIAIRFEVPVKLIALSRLELERSHEIDERDVVDRIDDGRSLG